MPSIAIGNQLYDSYKNHSLGSYEETLLQNFQDESILTLRNDPETIAAEAEEQYQASKEGNMPMEDDGSCLCECHIYDKALAEGKIAPVSLGTIPKSKTHPKQQWRARTIQWRKKSRTVKVTKSCSPHRNWRSSSQRKTKDHGRSGCVGHYGYDQ